MSDHRPEIPANLLSGEKQVRSHRGRKHQAVHARAHLVRAAVCACLFGYEDAKRGTGAVIPVLEIA